MSKPEAILATLTSDDADDWQRVGAIMRKLNGISEVSAEGRPWHDVLLETLAGLGHQMSSGHLHRIRRSFVFLEEGMKERRIPEERARIAKISSLDQAERLFQLDREAGLDALEACLDIKKPATKIEIQKRYEDFLAAHPEKKTPMQAAWTLRRSNNGNAAVEADVDHSVGKQPPSFATTLRRIADYVATLEAASQEDTARIIALEQEISDVNAELMETKQHLQITLEELSDLRKRKMAGWD